jgi:hypothetical protein
MRLAEALAERADAQKRLEQLKARACASARFQEGEEPSEDSLALLTEAEEVLGRLEELIRRINRTNASSELEPSLTITDAIARRDALRMRRRFVADVADAASGQGQGHFGMRQLRSELRQVTALDVASLRRRVDDLAREHRELDTRIQQTNWEVDLVE